MALCSDVETDDGKKEKKSLWPQFMQDDVWAERVKFRRMLKNDMPKYKERMEGDKGRAFGNWWFNGLNDKQRLGCFQMPKEELHVQFNTVFNFKPAYQVVLCAVIEQVERFDQTGYACDGATDGELAFEVALRGKKGAFIIAEEYVSIEEGGCDLFLEMLINLGGPHLLPVRPKELRVEAELAREVAEKDDHTLKNISRPKATTSGSDSSSTSADSSSKSDASDSEYESDDSSKGSVKVKKTKKKKEKKAKASEASGENDDDGPGQSFRADRRLVRLCIFRYL